MVKLTVYILMSTYTGQRNQAGMRKTNFCPVPAPENLWPPQDTQDISPIAHHRSYLRLLCPLTGNTEHHVQNSRDYAEKMERIKLENDEVLASSNVSSLFTNVPVNEAVEVIQEQLIADKTVPERSNLSPVEIANLLYTCLRSMCFTYREKYYEQREWGSPVSPIVADLYMEFLRTLPCTQLQADQGCGGDMWMTPAVLSRKERWTSSYST